jgi:hypothetical protein
LTSIGCKNYKCGERKIISTFIGFQQSEIDTLVVKRFTANDGFRTLMDSFLITNRELTGIYGNGIYTIIGDTTLVAIDGNYPNIGIYPGYDWSICIPGRNRTVSISNIVSADNEGSRHCFNPINSFKVDDVVITSPNYFVTQDYNTIGYRAYISR